MPSCVSPDTRNALFADEAKLHRTISSIDDQVALQNDLTALNDWSKTWDIDFNPKKKKKKKKKKPKQNKNWGTARNKRAPPPQSESHAFGVILTLFGVIFTRFGMIFTRFESDFHSVRVVLTLFTLLKSNHFTLFTLRESSLLHKKLWYDTSNQVKSCCEYGRSHMSFEDSSYTQPSSS